MSVSLKLEVHKHNIVHRDIKPENTLAPEDVSAVSLVGSWYDYKTETPTTFFSHKEGWGIHVTSIHPIKFDTPLKCTFYFLVTIKSEEQKLHFSSP